jgi:hypothetical protein
MKKKYIIIIIVIAVIFSLSYLSTIGIQTVSTDKNTYSIGEEVKIQWSDFSLDWCTCSNKDIQIFKQESTEWKRIQYELYGFGGGACVDGKLANLAMPCDIVSCSLPKPNFKNGEFYWNSKTYELIGTVDSCLNPYNNETVNVTVNDYELKNAPSGKYKIVFGNVQEIIEIK